MKIESILTGLVVFLVFLFLFLLSALILMVVGNMVLGYYDIKQLDYPTSLAISVLIWIYRSSITNGGS